MGLVLGMTGGGGSIMTVPILVYLFRVDVILATSYSLFIVGFASLVGGYSYLKRGDINLKAGALFAVPSFFGVYLSRAFIIPNLPDPVFTVFEIAVSKPTLIMSAFAILMLVTSFSVLNKAKKTEVKILINPPHVIMQGFAVGMVTGFVGAGGGFLIVPALVVLLGLPMKTAVGTSLIIIAANSAVGFLGDILYGLAVDWFLLLTLLFAALVGLFIGITLAKKVSDTNLKRGFAYFVLVMGLCILADQLWRL
jgi:uncharacterized membrane protein YfcA